jgi:hypothetical protein
VTDHPGRQLIGCTSRDGDRRVGANWLTSFNQSSRLYQPQLVLPNSWNRALIRVLTFQVSEALPLRYVVIPESQLLALALSTSHKLESRFVRTPEPSRADEPEEFEGSHLFTAVWSMCSLAWRHSHSMEGPLPRFGHDASYGLSISSNGRPALSRGRELDLRAKGTPSTFPDRVDDRPTPVWKENP